AGVKSPTHRRVRPSPTQRVTLTVPAWPPPTLSQNGSALTQAKTVVAAARSSSSGNTRSGWRGFFGGRDRARDATTRRRLAGTVSTPSPGPGAGSAAGVGHNGK